MQVIFLPVYYQYFIGFLLGFCRVKDRRNHNIMIMKSKTKIIFWEVKE